LPEADQGNLFPSRSGFAIPTGDTMSKRFIGVRDGTVIRTYTEIDFFAPDSSGRLTPASGDPCPLYGLEPQGEAVDFLNDTTLVLTSESAGAGSAPIHGVLISPRPTGG
jgi:hypothetical protein